MRHRDYDEYDERRRRLGGRFDERSGWRGDYDRESDDINRPGDYGNYGANYGSNYGVNTGYDYRSDIDRGHSGYGRYGEGRRATGLSRGRTRYSHLRCRDIMTKDVTTCTPEMNIVEVARLMRDEDIGALPVVEDGKLAGVVTDRDIVVRAIADKDQNLLHAKVKDVMTDDVYSVRPNDRLVDAIRKMGDKQVRRILVTDSNGRLRGIISMADVALESEQDHELAEALEEISESKSWFSRLFS